ncbi:MAG TPA: hypothetical protein VMF50_14930 [Candidatus Binataceae bacterium]|nr:hypothetical protein [Candidatus Binataceae bacterium]
MSDTKISFMVGCGWFAAGVGAIAGAMINPGGNALSYFISAIFFLLAIGIFMRIDWCAVIALVIFIGLRIQFYEVAVAIQQRAGNGRVVLGFWLSAIIFTQLYVLGVIGTLLWNRRRPVIRYALASLIWRGGNAVSPEAEHQPPRIEDDRRL